MPCALLLLLLSLGHDLAAKKDYIGYVNFRDYEYLCWVKFGTNIVYV